MTSSPLPPDPYAILSVSKDATLATIRSAHRKLVLTCHPDKVYDESVKAQKADQFHQVQQAYEILSDDSRRSLYDERVKLAELRAEVMAQTGGRSKVVHDFFPPRPSATSTYETRGNAVYEERAPRRSYEEDFTSSTYDDYRPSGRKYDDRYEVLTPRRSSGRGLEERRRARDYEEEDRQLRAREAAKAAERSSHVNRKKVRSQGRRQDYDSKYDNNYRNVQVESDSDSDSDSTERLVSDRRTSEPKKKYDDVKRREKEDRQRRSYKHDESDYTDEHETKIQYRVLNAADYIAKSSGVGTVTESSEQRRPSLGRIYSKSSQAPPPPPPPAPPPPVDVPRRSSGRTRSSLKERRTPEIVEPARRDYDSGARRPNLSAATSEPLNIHVPPRGLPLRAATLEVRSPDPKQPSPLRRSKTSPLASMVSNHRGDSAPSKSSKLRSAEVHDSGYSSPGTPELRAGYSPSFTSTKYQVPLEEDEDDFVISSPRVVNIEPDYRRERDMSPRTQTRIERPSPSIRGSASTRPPPSRSATFAEPSTPRAPVFVRTKSSHPPPSPAVERPLFGEVKYASDIKASDIKYSRRVSADSGRDHRDAYAKSGRSSHQGMGSRSASYMQEPVH
ncbi:hypothetical protein MMC13_007012 [Lambiella insularis]|nr:hypothetical protein [Lambiella insularis]